MLILKLLIKKIIIDNIIIYHLKNFPWKQNYEINNLLFFEKKHLYNVKMCNL
jgi:hypothetical protein